MIAGIIRRASVEEDEVWDLETFLTQRGFWKLTSSTFLSSFVCRTDLLYEVKTNFVLGCDLGVQMRRNNCLCELQIPFCRQRPTGPFHRLLPL